MNLAQDAVVVFANQAFVSMVYDPIVARFFGSQLQYRCAQGHVRYLIYGGY